MSRTINLLNEPLSHLLYADDLVLLSTTQLGINNALMKLEKFCETWELQVNRKKSQIVIFTPSGRKLGGFHFQYQKQNLEIVKSYCYLGIDLTASGSFNLARKTLMEKARKALFPLLSTISQFQIPCIKAIKLFKSMIQPIALYNSENLCHFNHHQIKALDDNKTTLLSYLIDSIPDKVQHKFLKFVLGVKRNCSNLAMLGEIGELPMSHHGLISMLSYWHRIALMQGDNLVKQALTLNYENGPAQSEWLASVQDLLNYLDLSHIFRNPDEIKNDKFSLICSQKLSQKLGKEWEN